MKTTLAALLFFLLTTGSAFDAKAAVPPALAWYPWLVNIGTEILTGTVEWATGMAWNFNDGPDNNGTLVATPSLDSTTGNLANLSWYHGSSSSSSQSTTNEVKYERYNMTVWTIAWDDSTQSFEIDADNDYWGEEYYTDYATYHTATQANGEWTSAGYWVSFGESEKVTGVAHTLESSVSGDTNLANHGPYTYTGKVTYTLADQDYINWVWVWTPRSDDYVKSEPLSATGSDSVTVELLLDNTKLWAATVSGSSDLSWLKINGTATNQAYNNTTQQWEDVSVAAKVWDIEQTTTL